MKGTGAAILHDILAPTFNVDHVILSRHGIYAVETKTRSKPRDAKVHFDGTTLRVDGRLEKEPIVQVIATADCIKHKLKEMTGKDYPVRPVLVFPGWYVNPVKEHRGARVWVLNPEAVPAFVTHEPTVISEADVSFAVYCLAREIRNTPDPA